MSSSIIMKIRSIICFAALMFANSLVSAQEVVVFDTITGTPSIPLAFLGNHANQNFGFPVTLAETSTITRVEIIRNVGHLAASFSYEIRNATPPYALIDSGTPTRLSSSPATGINAAAILDDFSINSSPLTPGDYFVAVYSDGVSDYGIYEGSGIVIDLLRDGAGIQSFDLIAAIYAQSIATSSAANPVPASTPLTLVLLSVLLGFAVYRKQKVKG